MTDHPPSFAEYEGCLPLVHGLCTWGLLALFAPVLHWVMEVIVGGLDPAPSLGTWMEFAAVMAMFGMIAGTVVFLAERSRSEWARTVSLAFFASLSVASIEEFIREPFGKFFLTTLMVSVFVALVLGSIFHALRRPKLTEKDLV